MSEQGDPRAPSPEHGAWCAKPRVPEPLLADAKRHASGDDLHSRLFRRTIYRCSRSTRSCSRRMKRSAAALPSRIGSGISIPAVRTVNSDPCVWLLSVMSTWLTMGAERTGPNAVWAVLMFDQEFQERPGYFGSRY